MLISKENIDEEFRSWLLYQERIRDNVSAMCNKYKSLERDKVPTKEIMFDEKSRLFFCRNAKVRGNVVHYKKDL